MAHALLWLFMRAVTLAAKRALIRMGIRYVTMIAAITVLP